MPQSQEELFTEIVDLIPSLTITYLNSAFGTLSQDAIQVLGDLIQLIDGD